MKSLVIGHKEMQQIVFYAFSAALTTFTHKHPKREMKYMVLCGQTDTQFYWALQPIKSHLTQVEIYRYFDKDDIQSIFYSKNVETIKRRWDEAQIYFSEVIAHQNPGHI